MGGAPLHFQLGSFPRSLPRNSRVSSGDCPPANLSLLLPEIRTHTIAWIVTGVHGITGDI